MSDENQVQEPTETMDPAQIMAAVNEQLDNAPKDYISAVQRIMELEMRLEDLSRAAEIVEITRQFELFEGFRTAADESLKTKILHKRENTGDLNLTVITGELDMSKINGAAQPQPQPQP